VKKAGLATCLFVVFTEQNYNLVNYKALLNLATILLYLSFSFNMSYRDCFVILSNISAIAPLSHKLCSSVSIPYIIKNHVEVNVYNKEGYQKYSYKNFRNIYHEVRHGEYIEGGKFTNAIDNKEFKDENRFPNFITVFVRNSLKIESSKRYLYWDFQKGTHPQQVKDLKSFDLPEGSVLFEDQRILTPQMGCECIEKEEDPFEIGNVEKSYLKIFLTAIKYNQYFFNFEPLRGFSREISNDVCLFFNEILYPIYKREGLSEKNKEAMLRFSEEFDLIELRNKLQEEFIKNVNI
jgi:hypothetical protein